MLAVLIENESIQFFENASLHFEEGTGAIGSNDHVYLTKSKHQSVELTFSAIFSAAKEYETNYQVKLAEGTDLELIRYGVSGAVALHADICKGITSPVSALVYLNNDYQGGELIFPEFKLQFKPKVEVSCFFQPHFAYLHYTTPITEGTKFVAYCTLTDELTTEK